MRRSEQRSYTQTHYDSTWGQAETRPKGHTFTLNESTYTRSRENKPELALLSKKEKIVLRPKKVEPSLSSKIKANLSKNKSRTLVTDWRKAKKPKTLFRSKESFEKNESKTLTNKLGGFRGQNTLRLLQRQNSGKGRPLGGLREKLKNQPVKVSKLPRNHVKLKNFKIRKNLGLKSPTMKKSVKHIGRIESEKHMSTPQHEFPGRRSEALEVETKHFAEEKPPQTPYNFSHIASDLRGSGAYQDEAESKPKAVRAEMRQSEIRVEAEEEAESTAETQVPLNPFARKPNQQLKLDLPDLGVHSSEKEKEDQTNLTDRKVDQLMNRRKTKYSKEVANYIQSKEFLNSPKKPKKKKLCKVIKMKWCKSSKAYVQVTEFEEVSADSEDNYQTPLKSPEAVSGSKPDTSLNRLKKFVNTPKDIKSQLRPEESLLSPPRQPLMYGSHLKKSNSTFAFDSTHDNQPKPDLKKDQSEVGDFKTGSVEPPMKAFARKGTTYFEEKAKHYFPIFENFGECPAWQYRLIIYKMDKNTKTDKIFFNNPTNYTCPEKLLTFDMRGGAAARNMSHSLVANLKCSHRDKVTLASDSSRYHDMSQVVDLARMLKPSLYHDLNALEMDFSFPEDKPKSPKRPKFFKLQEGAQKIGENTFRIGDIEFKDLRGCSNVKSTSNLMTVRPSQSSWTASNGLSKRSQHKSYTNLLSSSQAPVTNRKGTESNFSGVFAAQCGPHNEQLTVDFAVERNNQVCFQRRLHVPIKTSSQLRGSSTRADTGRPLALNYQST